MKSSRGFRLRTFMAYGYTKSLQGCTEDMQMKKFEKPWFRLIKKQDFVLYKIVFVHQLALTKIQNIVMLNYCSLEYFNF